MHIIPSETYKSVSSLRPHYAPLPSNEFDNFINIQRQNKVGRVEALVEPRVVLEPLLFEQLLVLLVGYYLDASLCIRSRKLVQLPENPRALRIY